MKLPYLNLEQLELWMDKYFALIDESLEKLNELTVKITEIPAPPFQEHNRASFMLDLFLSLGYDGYLDEINNIVINQPKETKEIIIISAHLDTVFDESIPISVKKDGDFLHAPGIGDDSRGLAVLYLLAKIIKNEHFNVHPVFVCTVGEEGEGDLRGVKHLFTAPEHAELFNKSNVKAFITIDGADSSRVVSSGVGSIRYKAKFDGPGGHSYGAFGMANPAFALGNFLSYIGDITVPDNPKTTFSVGVVGGGTSINSIPYHVWCLIDLRSEDAEELKKLEKIIKSKLIKAVEKENSIRSQSITSSLELIGSRPVGHTDSDTILMKAITSVNKFLGINTSFSGSSTDANIPMSMGIPAISIAGVEQNWNAHSLNEYIDASEKSLTPVKRNLLLLLTLCI